MNTQVNKHEELQVLAQRIIDSGVLGRSRHYRAMLEYLVQCSIDGKSPKEIDLALDVLERGEEFDVSADSTVRVYVHQLRKKLENYYGQHDVEAKRRITIPKGQYNIVVEDYELTVDKELGGASSYWNSRLNTALLTTACVLLVLNIVVTAMWSSGQEDVRGQAAAEHAIWGSVLTDAKPILLVMGDYYIFGELNANGNIARMVREFNVNSRSDLEELQFTDIERAENYLDLDLSYMPEGSAFALARIVPILQGSEKPVNITMMSDLTMADIRNNHIVYIGYISALEKLTGLTFAGSGLQIGRSYDELFNEETEEYYTSDAGLPEEGEPFRDYGMFATFPASVDTQVVLVTGMRDAGLMHTAQALSNTASLDELVVAMEDDTDEAVASFEALYEVFGVDRMNFNANLVYTNHLDTSQIWSAPQEFELN